MIEPAEEAQAFVDRGLAFLERRGIPATGETVIDHSVPCAIAWAAERHGASHEVPGSPRPDLSGLLLGSGAHEAIHRLPCPVLLAGRVMAGEAVR